MPMQKRTLSLPSDFWDHLDREAAHRSTSVAQVVRDILHPIVRAPSGPELPLDPPPPRKRRSRPPERS
jgi:hypothetical protein